MTTTGSPIATESSLYLASSMVTQATNTWVRITPCRPNRHFLARRRRMPAPEKVYQLVQPEFAHDGHWRAKFIKHKFYLYFNREVR